jgi:dTDP-4-dehydrorhamnose 3,5-epimerase
MLFSGLTVAGAWLVTPEQRGDERGFFARTWCTREFAEHGISAQFVQASVSFNEIAGTLRGMHYQAEPFGETKLVRCTAGAIYDVVIDLRPASASYMKWQGEVLSAENRAAFYIPEGCAHGFITLADKSEVLYEISAFHEASAACGVRWNDPAFAIAWPREPARISQRDAAYPSFSKPSAS